MAPTTPKERRAQISTDSRGFFYLVSTVGITGERKSCRQELTELIAETKGRRLSPSPSVWDIDARTGREAGKVADGMIIGSRLVRAVADAPDSQAAVAAVTGFLSQTRAALAR